MILRGVLLVLGAAAATAGLVLGRPDSFGVTMPAALLAIVVGAGAIAADATPRRPVPLTCSVLTVVLALAMLGRSSWQPGLAGAIAALQLVALTWPAIARRRAGPAALAPDPGR